MNAILTSITDLKTKKALSLPSQRLTIALDLLQQFFNAGSNGLDYAEMNNDAYKVSHDILRKAGFFPCLGGAQNIYIL